jgi:hypothetical protein
MNALATLFPAMRDKIFFWARRPISRALNALSLMTAKMLIIEQIEKINQELEFLKIDLSSTKVTSALNPSPQLRNSQISGF